MQFKCEMIFNYSMKKPLKIAIVIIIIIFGASKIGEWYLEYKFNSIINTNPKRTYDITYDNFSLHTFFNGITLNHVKITPISKNKETIVDGTVDYAELNGFEWYKFLLSKSLSIDELLFVEPIFKVSVQTDSIKKSRGQTFQNLFNDVLSRADLKQFQIKSGSVVFKEHDSILKGQIHNINLLATEIETDSLILTDIIPFKLEGLEISIDSSFYKLNEHTKVNLGTLDYSIADKELLIKKFRLKNNKDWVSISLARGIQNDVVEFELNELRISGMDLSSSFWTNLDINAQKMEIDGLNLSLMRNKNLPRPPDEKKPMFKGMVDKIPNNINLDSINITNTQVTYGELNANKHKAGKIQINDINGSITKFSTFPERKNEFEEFKAEFNAKLNNSANMTIKFTIPYDKDAFELQTVMGPMNMRALNKSTVPLLGVEINKGRMKRLEYYMNASYYQSQNKLIMDYEDLHLTVFQEEKDGESHKNSFVSSIANAAVRQDNLPENKNYQQAIYTSERNIYRSPFQYMVAGILDGAKLIVPIKGLKSIFKKKTKKKKHKKSNN